MNFNDYFAKQAELTMRVLVEVPEVPSPVADQRLIGIGASCLVAATALHVWASQAFIDPGYFARSSTFGGLMFLAGIFVLICAGASSAWVTRARVTARELLKERTVARLITADRVVAHQLAAGAAPKLKPEDSEN